MRKLQFAVNIIAIIALLTSSYLWFTRIDVQASQQMLSLNIAVNNQYAITGDTRPQARTTFIDKNGLTKPINNALQSAAIANTYEMVKAGYNVKIKNNITSKDTMTFSYKNESISLQPGALEWASKDGKTSLISTLENVQALTGNNQKAITKDANNTEGYIIWPDAYGKGIDFKWNCAPEVLEKTLIIDELDSLPKPPSELIEPTLRLCMILTLDDNIDIIADGKAWNKKDVLQTYEMIYFYSHNEELWHIKPLSYWDSLKKSMPDSIFTLKNVDNNLTIETNIPYVWLERATYPVYIDADITIETIVTATLNESSNRGGIYWTSTTVGYLIFIDGFQDLKYRKTSDGGGTWANAVNIRTGTVVTFDAYPDWAVAGDAGTKIHIAYIDNDDATGVRYVYLDTASDTVGGDDQIEDIVAPGTLYGGASRLYHTISITKSRGGNICVTFHYTSAAPNYTHAVKFYTSPNGDTWTSKATCAEAGTDFYFLFPANLADNQDIWCLYFDGSDSELSLKTYDDSADSWAETSILTGVATNNFINQISGAVRLSDGHLIATVWNTYDTTSSDLKVYDITNAGTITAKTDVITNEAESICCGVFVNQANNDLYVAYFSGTAAESQIAAFYKKSTDGGTNWGGETAMQADAEDDERWISCGAVRATTGGYFMPVWFNDDLTDIFCNTTNAVAIAAAGGYSITITPTTLAMGTVTPSTAYYAKGSAPADPEAIADGDCTFTITNDGSAAEKINIKSTNFTNYNLAASASSTEVKMSWYVTGMGSGDYVVMTTSDQQLIASLAASAHTHGDFRLDTITGNGNGAAQTATVTLTAVAP